MKELVILTAFVAALGLIVVNGVEEPVRALVDGINSTLHVDVDKYQPLGAKFVVVDQ